jgi:hypothetical protein
MQEYIDQVKKSKGDGVGGLLKFLIGLAVPGANLLMNLPGRGLDSLKTFKSKIYVQQILVDQKLYKNTYKEEKLEKILKDCRLLDNN